MASTTQVNVRLPVELAARLRQRAAVTGTREGQIVAAALAEFLPPLTRPPADAVPPPPVAPGVRLGWDEPPPADLMDTLTDP